MSVITGGSWGFTGSDVWSNVMLIVLSLSTFFLVRYAVSYVPLMVETIYGAIESKKYTGSYDFRRNYENHRNWREKERMRGE